MSRSFLFGGSAAGGSQNKYLVEFKAGKMSMKDKIVSADKRKGTVFVHQTDDSLMHFCWKDRTSGAVEDDLIIFPDDVVFKRVPECVTGRVFVLKFKSSSRRCFYWLQEPKTDRDSEFCNKVNQYLNNPPTGSSRGGAGGLGSSTPSISGLQAELNSIGDGGDLHSILNNMNNMSQQQLLQILGGVGSMNVASLSSLLGSAGRMSSSSTSGTASAASELPRTVPETARPAPVVTTAPTPQPVSTPPTMTSSTLPTSTQPLSNASIQLSDLQTILSGMNVPAQSGAAQGSSVDLSSALTAEALLPLINNKELMDRLTEHLPSSELTTPLPSSEQLRSTIQSPQFQQALSIFSAALQSGQLGPLMQQFGMSADVVNAANSGDMDAFVRALQAAKQSSEAPAAGSTAKPKGKDQDKDEDMSLD